MKKSTKRKCFQQNIKLIEQTKVLIKGFHIKCQGIEARK